MGKDENLEKLKRQDINIRISGRSPRVWRGMFNHRS
jgi:hypothetical protein